MKPRYLEKALLKKELNQPLSRQENFSLLCSKVMTSYENTVGPDGKKKWSSMELKFWESLRELHPFLIWYKNIWHNFRIQNMRGSGLYSLDFLVLSERDYLVLELDGPIWHSTMGDRDKSDERKDDFVRGFFGTEVIHVREEKDFLLAADSLRAFLRIRNGECVKRERVQQAII